MALCIWAIALMPVAVNQSKVYTKTVGNCCRPGKDDHMSGELAAEVVFIRTSWHHLHPATR